MRGKLALALISITLATGLIAGLIAYSGVRAADIASAALSVPLWLFGAVFALTIANQWLGVMRWQAANRWFQPEAAAMSGRTMFEATTWGALLGQILPPQISMTSARWIATRRSSSVGVTLYEQLFDMIILSAGGIAALVLLASPAPGVTAFVLFALIIAVGCLSMRLLLRAAHAIADAYSGSALPFSRIAGRLADPFALASRAPARVLGELTALSIARMIVLALRLILIAVVFAPAIAVLLVAIGYPVVGLASAVPILPGGLGLTEWSLTGLLVHAGAPGAAQAALVAIMVRLIVLVALLALCLMLLGASRFWRTASDSPLARPSARA